VVEDREYARPLFNLWRHMKAGLVPGSSSSTGSSPPASRPAKAFDGTEYPSLDAMEAAMQTCIFGYRMSDALGPETFTGPISRPSIFSPSFVALARACQAGSPEGSGAIEQVLGNMLWDGIQRGALLNWMLHTDGRDFYTVRVLAAVNQRAQLHPALMALFAPGTGKYAGVFDRHWDIHRVVGLAIVFLALWPEDATVPPDIVVADGKWIPSDVIDRFLGSPPAGSPAPALPPLDQMALDMWTEYGNDAGFGQRVRLLYNVYLLRVVQSMCKTQPALADWITQGVALVAPLGSMRKSGPVDSADPFFNNLQDSTKRPVYVWPGEAAAQLYWFAHRDSQSLDPSVRATLVGQLLFAVPGLSARLT
jgi:hypothetical protein